MSSKIFSAAVIGLDAQIIEIETEVSNGLRSFTIVGLPDKAVEESKERIGAALKSSGFQSPFSKSQRVLVNLAPADLKKEGSLYDLPIALGYLLTSKQVCFDPGNKLFLAELALDGQLRPIKGALSFGLKAKAAGFSEIVLPQENAAEASLVKGLKTIGASRLSQVIKHLLGQAPLPGFRPDSKKSFFASGQEVNLGWIKGQDSAKRALLIMAAGNHHLLMVGPPGAGKTLLAKSSCSVLPPLSFDQALEVTKIYSVAGLLTKNQSLVTRPPFRSPHHTCSESALIGGGNPVRPGEITLAHQGILFLDELPEFHRDVLESLRQPLEEGEITILRARQRLTLPSRFTLIAASNPCPCGFYNDPEKQCCCASSQIQKYRRKLSGPLMDRFDLFVPVPRLEYKELISKNSNESEIFLKRVQSARQKQRQRFGQEKTNSQIKPPEIKTHCQLSWSSHLLLKKYVDSGQLSARGFHRVLRVSRTIADLEDADQISRDHLLEALSYRFPERIA